MTDEHDTPSGTLKTVADRKTDRFHLTAKVSQDRLKLFIDLKPLAPMITAEEIIAAIDFAPHHLIDRHYLGELIAEVNTGKSVEKRRIAKGRPAVDGRDARLVYLIRPYQPNKRGGQIDFVDARFMRAFDNVETGTLIARVYPPTSGTEGHDALGQPLKAKPGKPIKVGVADSVDRRPPNDGEGFETLVSKIAGYVAEDNGKVTVKSELVLKESVGFKTGDIDFVGDVTVKGDVLKDFKIFARGNITVSGNTLSAAMISNTGSIVIKGNAGGTLLTTVLAGNQTEEKLASEVAHRAPTAPDFQAAGTFTAHTVNGVSVQSRGDIIITKEASHCLLNSQGALRMPQGHLFGATVRVVCGLEASIIGTGLGAPTEIYLASDIESTAEYTTLLGRIKEHQSAEELLKLHLGPYATNRDRVILINEPHRSRLQKLIKKLDTVSDSLTALLTEKEQLLLSAKHNPTLRINFLKLLYPGTRIHVGNHTFETEVVLQGPGTVEFLPAPEKFVISELKPLECMMEET